MALSFPINPTPGQTYTYSGRTWVWTGSAWKVNDTGAINGIIIGNTTPAAGSFTELTANSTVNLGNVANVVILGGSNGQVLSTDGTGNLAWSSAGAGLPGGSNTQVQFNDGGVFGASSAFTFDKTSNTLTVTNIAGTVTTNTQPNITSVGTLTSANVTGNLLVGTTRNDGYWGNELKYTQSAIEYSDTATTPNSANVGLAILNRNQTNLNYSVLVLGTRNAEETGNPLGMASVYSINRANQNPADASGELGFAVKTGETLGLVEKMRLSTAGLTVTGNVTGGTGAFVTVTGNANASSLTSGTVPSARLSGSYTINISGSATSATTAATVTTNAQPNITSVGTLTALTVSGNITTSGQFTGSGAGLTDIPGANVTGTVANATYATSAGSAGSATYAASAIDAVNITGNAQPNITSVGILSSLSVTGNITGGNIIANGRPLTSLNASNLDTGTVPSARLSGSYTINISGSAATATSATTAATVTTNAQPNITSVGTLTSLSVTGNVTSGNLSATKLGLGTASPIETLDVRGQGYFGAANARVRVEDPDIINGPVAAMGVVGTSHVYFSSNSDSPILFETGFIERARINNVGLSVTGNITGGNIIANGRPLTSLNASNLDTGTVPSARLSGSYTIDISGSATTAGTVTTAAQPNITSVGTLSSLSVTGNVTTSGQFTGSGAGLSSIPGANVVGVPPSAQPLDADLTAIAALTGTSGLLRKTAANTWSLDTSSYLTTNQTITLSGDVSGSGTTAITTTLANSGVTAATYGGNNSIPSLTIDAKGRVTAASTVTPSGTWGISVSGSAATAGTVTTAAQPNITSVGTLSSVNVSGAATLPDIYINRSGSTSTGINWYSSGYTAWTDYMSPAGQTNSGPTNNITAPSGTLVTSWALRSFIENGGGYGWTFESGSSNQTTPNVVAEIRSSDGAARFGSVTTTGSGGNITGANVVSATTITTSQITKSGTSGVGNIGASGATFNTVFARATSAQYADLAEAYAADAEYAPGTVLVFGGSAEVTLADQHGDTRVAGVVSTQPAHVMNSALNVPFTTIVALTGRVPTRVTGPVRKGDMMVSAGNGYACACSTPSLGSVIGKALENFDGESGTIEVVVGRL